MRAQAEKILDPELLRQVCVDPYLTAKMERIRANAEEQSHWETTRYDPITVQVTLTSASAATVRVDKIETKLFYPRYSRLPDDKICAGPVNSYRNCEYAATYQMVLQDGRWYVAEATAQGNCPALCRKPAPMPSSRIALPEAASPPEGWPILPSDLYFIREGRLWRWPQTGGELVELPLAIDLTVEEVAGYRLASGGGTLAYYTTTGHLYVLDLATGHTVWSLTVGQVPWIEKMFPTDGDTFALTPDGRYLVYVVDADTAGSRQIYAADIHSGRSSEVALCQGGPFGDGSIKCGGFFLSPDGRQVTYMDVQGIWLAQVPEGQARLVASHTHVATNSPADQIASPGTRVSGLASVLQSQTGSAMGSSDRRVAASPSSGYVLFPLGLSPDGKWLLADAFVWEGDSLLVIDIATGNIQAIPDTWCYGDCYREQSIRQEGVWVSQTWATDADPAQIYLARVVSEEELQVTMVISENQSTYLVPTEIHPLDGERVVFASRTCLGIDGPGPAIMIGEAGSYRQVAPLPQVPCLPNPSWNLLTRIDQASILWSPNATSFLYLDKNGVPILLGSLDGTVLWDVRDVLAGAREVQWGGARY